MADKDGRLRIAVLGCSGSIGTQTLDVCRTHRDKVRIVAASVQSSLPCLIDAVHEFDIDHVAIGDESYRHDGRLDELPAHCDVSFGADAIVRLAELDEVDCVVTAVVGSAGIAAGIAAVRAGKRLAYANKESIVVAGDLMMPLLAPGQMVPVDSEHSAIFQCLTGEPERAVRAIWLTCSGGPFYGKTRDELATVTASDALAHPTWNMGAKITIDSATLMNKGLEVLEATHLFGVGVDDVRVLVQRQSRIHSMVEFVDGSVKAQLGPSDMRIPIQYGLSYPNRWDAPCTPTDWYAEAPLTFGEADEEAFGCLALARESGRVGGTMPCVLNAANEVANEALRNDRCGFLDIERIVSGVMDRTNVERVESIEQLCLVDEWARSVARSLL